MTLNDPELMVREWLEKIYALAGPGADMAKAAIDLVGDNQGAREELDGLLDRFEVDDFREAAKRLAEYRDLTEWAEDTEVIQNLVAETLEESLNILVKQYEVLERQSFDLQELCAEAGLLAPNDHDTDPLPLLRMFLPV